VIIRSQTIEMHSTLALKGIRRAGGAAARIGHRPVGVCKIFVMGTSQHDPCDAIVNEHKRDERRNSRFGNRMIHTQMLGGAGTMPPIFMTLLAVSLVFSPACELRTGPCHKCEDRHDIKPLTAPLSATVRCDAVADYFDPVPRQFRRARLHRHSFRRMFVPPRIFVIAFQSIAHLYDGK
jgi:hypothetical protein